MKLKTLLIALAAVMVVGVTPSSFGQSFTRPVKIVTSSAGSVSDLLSRLIAPKLGERLGQPAIVDNRSSAGGGRPMAIAGAQLPPDGYGYMITPGPPMVLTPLTVKDPGFDPSRDFTPVGMLGISVMGFAVSAHEPVTSIAEFVTYARSKPGQLNYGGFGTASPQHMAMNAFAQNRQLSMVPVPYNGIGPAIVDLTSGRTNAMVSALNQLLPLAQSGKLRILAVAGESRLPFLPDVPTTKELGITEIVNLWFGMFAPAKTPPEYIARVNREVNAILAAPEAIESLAKQAVTVSTSSPAEFAAFLKRDVEFWRKLANAAGVVPE